MAFSDSFLDELTARTDIVELIARSVDLKKSGGRFWGLCPFHGEKTPSFTVSPDKQLYHCFGCGAGGGAIQFVMQSENMDFPEAVRHLAQAAGLPIPEDDGDTGAARRRERLLALNRAAAAFYVDQMPDSRAASGLPPTA